MSIADDQLGVRQCSVHAPKHQYNEVLVGASAAVVVQKVDCSCGVGWARNFFDCDVLESEVFLPVIRATRNPHRIRRGRRSLTRHPFARKICEVTEVDSTNVTRSNGPIDAVRIADLYTI